ncbi:MAG: hypothetical protein ACLPYY_19335 [Acidimicrobiales bacterium]
MTEPPAEILRRLRPIPVYADRPTTSPRDVAGVGPDGLARVIEVERAAEPVLLLFLSAGCLGCRDLWEGLTALGADLAGAARLAVVTKDPGEEDPGAIAALAGAEVAPLGIDVVMSSRAFRDYRVGGPPFLAVVTADAVLTESVAWGLEQTLRTALGALRRG